MISETNLITSPSVRETENEDGLALLDVVQGVCFSVNPVGSNIWALLKQNVAPAAISRQIACEYTISTEEASHDVDEFVGNLLRLKLLSSETPKLPRRFDRMLTFVQRFRKTEQTG